MRASPLVYIAVLLACTVAIPRAYAASKPPAPSVTASTQTAAAASAVPQDDDSADGGSAHRDATKPADDAANDNASMRRLEAIRNASEQRQNRGTPLTLEQALDIALSQSPTLALSKAATHVAEQKLDATRSDYRPNISASAGIELNTGSGYVAGSSQLSPIQKRSTATTFNASISASQLIYDFGAHRGDRRAAQANVRAAHADHTQELNDVRQSVIAAYLQAGAARKALAVAREDLHAETQRAKQIQAKVEVGLRPPIDRATARANVASATARLVDANTQYDLDVFDLLAAMGVDEDHDIQVAWTTLDTRELEELRTDQLRDLAQQQRGDFQSLTASLDAAEEGIRATNAGILPTLNAVAGASESLLIGKNGRWNAYIGARINWDIYRGGQIRMQKRVQQAQRDQLSKQKDAMLVSVVQSIHRAQRKIKGAKVLVDARHIASLNAQKQLDLAQARYKTGLGDVVELTDAQLSWTQAKNDEIDAQLQLDLARASLITAVAGW